MPLSLITGPLIVRRQTAARDNKRAVTRPNTGIHHSRNLALSPNVRRTQSFFPCFSRMATLINNTLRRLRVLPRSPVALKEAATAHKIYKCFREFEHDFRMMMIGRYPDKFFGAGLSAAEIKRGHQAFDRYLELGFSKFPDTLGEARAKHPDLDFPKLLCKAYGSMIDKASAKVGGGYEKAIETPKRKLLAWMEMAITPKESPPSSIPESMSASESMATDDLDPIAENTPVDYLSKKEVKTFADLQFTACQLICERKKNEADADDREWPANSIAHFQVALLDDLGTTLADLLSSGGVSKESLHAAHHRAIASAMSVAFNEGIATQEVRGSDAKAFKKLLTDICKDIGSEVSFRVDPGMAKLFPPERRPSPPGYVDSSRNPGDNRTARFLEVSAEVYENGQKIPVGRVNNRGLEESPKLIRK
jgi:hypothetical protein